MDILYAINPSFALSGFLVGVLVGLTGVGGGSLMTPLLVLIFGVQELSPNFGDGLKNQAAAWA